MNLKPQPKKGLWFYVPLWCSPALTLAMEAVASINHYILVGGFAMVAFLVASIPYFRRQLGFFDWAVFCLGGFFLAALPCVVLGAIFESWHE